MWYTVWIIYSISSTHTLWVCKYTVCVPREIYETFYERFHIGAHTPNQIVETCICLKFICHLGITIDWLFLFPKIHKLKTIPIGVLFGDGFLGRWLDHESNTLMNGISVFVKEPAENSFAFSVTKDIAKRQTLTEIRFSFNTKPVLILDLPVFITMSNNFLVFISH